MTNRTLLPFTILCCLIFPAQAQQQPTSPSAPRLPSPGRVGIERGEQTPLSLLAAIEMALENNTQIEISRIDVQLSQFDLAAARGVYDPQLASENYLQRATTPVASIIGGGANGSVRETQLVSSNGLTGFTPVGGGSYQISFDSSRLTTNNLFTNLNPQFPSSLTATYTQPLLRGLFFDDRRRRIEVAQETITLSDAQFRQRTIEIIAQVESAYWDLVFALKNREVQLSAVEQARRQVESNQRQVDQGTLAAIDVVEAETQVATFEQEVFRAEEQVSRAENTLKTLLLPRRNAPLWNQAILPTTPIRIDPPRVPLEEAIQSALTNRPELDLLEANAEINRINTRFFRDQTRPQIDLVATAGVVGLAGTVVQNTTSPFTRNNELLTQWVNELSTRAGLPPLPDAPPLGTIPAGLIGGYNQSLSNLFGFNYPTARFGFRFSLPLGNRTAEANLGRSLAEGRRILTQRAQQEQTIEADVRNTMQAMRSVEARLRAAAAARSAAEQQYASERRRFEAGLSTVFLVLQRQTDLVTAKGRELQAQTDLSKAVAEFQRAIGRTLQSNRITVRVNSK